MGEGRGVGEAWETCWLICQWKLFGEWERICHEHIGLGFGSNLGENERSLLGFLFV